MSKAQLKKLMGDEKVKDYDSKNGQYVQITSKNL